MKTRIMMAVCAALIAGLSTTSARAYTQSDPLAVAADALLGRPLCFAATVVGSAIFVVSLPAAIPSKSVHSTAQTLVVKPARATFVRPLGDFDYDGGTESMAKRPLKGVARKRG
jgi:hypothetical protein